MKLKIKSRLFEYSLLIVSIMLILSLSNMTTSFAYTSTSVKVDVVSDAGPQTVSFRDLTDFSFDDPSGFAITADKSEYLIGDTATITVTFDSPANLDHNQIDYIVVDVYTSEDPTILPLELTETEIDSGVFVGSFTFTAGPTLENSLHFGGNIITAYETPYPYAGRFEMTLDGITNGGTVILSDEPITEDDEVNNGIGAIIDSVRITFDGVTVDEDPSVGSASIKIGYMNSVMTDPFTFPEGEICLLHQAVTGGPFLILTQGSLFGSPHDEAHDFDNLAITNVNYPTSTGIDFHPEGRYVLAFCTGSPGGGGGGLSKAGFVVNALAGMKTVSAILGTGGGGGGASPPILGTTSFSVFEGGKEGFGGIIKEDKEGSVVNSSSFKVGQPAEIRMDYIETGGLGNVEFVGFYTNIRDGQTKHASDTYVYYEPYKPQPLTIHDPNGYFSSFNVKILQKDVVNFVLKFEFTFAKPMQKSDIIIESWNMKRWASNTLLANSIESVAAPSGVVQTSVVASSFTEDIVNDKIIPVWVKNNARWWYADQIDNVDFVSGIEYLINKNILVISAKTGTETTSVSDVPLWIKNNAGWWSDGKISDEDFLNGIQWLITNNVIKVAA